MPKALLYTGCLLFFFSVLIINTSVGLSLDSHLLHWLSTQRNEPLNRIAMALSWIGSLAIVVFLSMVLIFFLALQKKYVMIGLISAGIFGSISLSWLAKYLVARPRPEQMYHLVTSVGDAFPSAHSCYAASLSCAMLYAFWHTTSIYVLRYVALCWLLIMGASRIYLGVH